MAQGVNSSEMSLGDLRQYVNILGSKVATKMLIIQMLGRNPSMNKPNLKKILIKHSNKNMCNCTFAYRKGLWAL